MAEAPRMRVNLDKLRSKRSAQDPVSEAMAIPPTDGIVSPSQEMHLKEVAIPRTKVREVLTRLYNTEERLNREIAAKNNRVNQPSNVLVTSLEGGLNDAKTEITLNRQLLESLLETIKDPRIPRDTIAQVVAKYLSHQSTIDTNPNIQNGYQNIPNPTFEAQEKKDYSDSIELIKTFLDENYEKREGASITLTEIYEAYCDWCLQKNEEPDPLPAFGRNLETLGLQRIKVGGRIRLLDIERKNPDSL